MRKASEGTLGNAEESPHDEQLGSRGAVKGWAGEIPVYCSFDEIVELDALRPNPKNPNQHPEEQLELLAKIIRAQGWRAPVTVSTLSGLIVRGNGRYMAAQRLGCPVPVDYQHYESEEAELADLVADNRLAELAEIDDTLLAAIMAGLDESEFDTDLTGYDAEMTAALLAGLSEESTIDEERADEVPEPPAEPVTRRGDVWQIGRHRLMCGDSTLDASVKTLFAGKQPVCIVTDPPYCSGGFQEAGKKAGSIGTRDNIMIANDTLSTRGYMALIKNVLACAGNMGIAYVFTDWRMYINLFDCCESSGFGVRNMIVWDKGSPGMGVGWRAQHEICVMASRTAQKLNPRKAQGNVITCGRTGNINHPTEKPVELIRKIIAVTDFADDIYDPFGGSGTTLLACELEGRNCFMMELEPAYCDVIVKRYAGVTGKRDITLIRNGEEIAAEDTEIFED